MQVVPAGTIINSLKGGFYFCGLTALFLPVSMFEENGIRGING